MPLLDAFIRQVQYLGTALIGRAALDFEGAGVAVTDDAPNNRLKVTIPGGVSAGDKAILDATHVAPIILGDALASHTLADGAAYQLPAATLTTSRVFIAATGGGEVTGSLMTLELLDATANTYTITNGGGGGGTIWTKPANYSGFIVIRFDGTNWVLYRQAAIYGPATTALAGLMSSADKTTLTNASSSATASVLALRDGSAQLFASAFKFADGAGLAEGAAAGGNGAPAVLQAQGGPSPGKTGGAAKLIAGNGGTPGTDASGGAIIDVGQVVANVSQSLSIQQNSTEFLSVKQTSSTSVTIALPQAAAGVGPDLILAPGLGKISGTDLTGNIKIPLGPSSGGFTSSINFDDGGTIFGRIRKSDAAYLRIEGQNTYGLYLNAPSSTAVLTGNAVQISPSLSVTTNSNLLQLQDSQSGLTYLELSRPASGQRVTWLNVGGNGSATKMPANTGDGVTFIGNAATEPTANCDNTGIVPYAFAARLRARDTYGVRSELGFTGSTGGATVTNKDSFRRQASLKSSVNGTTATILQIPAADWPLAKKFVANVHWTVQGYDETNNSVYCAEYRSTIKGVDGVNCAVQTGGTGATLIGSADDGTAGDVGATPFNVARDGSNNINTTITTIKGDTVVWSVWADIKIVSDT